MLGAPAPNANSAGPTTVYIPGNLRVDGDIELAVAPTSRIKVRLGRGHSGNNTGTLRMSYLVRNEADGGLADEVLLGNPGGNMVDLPPELPSDRRLKNVGKAFVGGLEEIKKLELFNYSYKKDPNKTPRVGVMAQDLQKIFPNAVTKGDDGFLRIRMEDMFYALVNAVKELADKFDIHEKKIVELEKQNKELNKTIAEFEKRLEKLEKKAK